jgi:hypothetical protein
MIRAQVFCLVFVDEDGRQVHLHRWEAVLVEQPAD